MTVLLDRHRRGTPDRWRTLGERVRLATLVVLGVLAAPALLTACGIDSGGDPARATATENSSTGVPADDATDGSSTWPEGTGPRTSRGAGGAPVVLTDVRVAEHEDLERIVLEFSGAGAPGWAVEYVDDATLEGSGEIVPLGGDATLDIHASNTTWPATDYYSGPKRLRGEDGALAEVHVVGTFEGHTQVLAGINGPRVPFRVFALADPSRLVVDVAEGGSAPSGP